MTCLLAAVGTVVWAVRTPTAVSDTATNPTAGKETTSTVAGRNARGVPELSALMAAAAVDLRKPLYDVPPPPPAVAAPPPPPPPLNVKLAGTVVEEGYSRAILVNPEGRTEFKRIGERSGDAEVLQIQPGKVTVRYHGEPIELTVERSNDAGGGM